MPLSAECWKAVLLCIGHSFLCALTFSLLLCPNYFRLSALDSDWEFGLTGVTSQSEFQSYSALSAKCLSRTNRLCVFFPQLETAGLGASVLLAASMVLESAEILRIAATRVLVLQALRAIGRRKQVTACVSVGGKMLSFLQYVTLLHPLFSLCSVIYWSVESRLSELSNLFALRSGPGLILLVIVAGFSLVFHTYLTVRLLANRQTNARLTEIRREAHPTAKLDTGKFTSGAITLDETTVGL